MTHVPTALHAAAIAADGSATPLRAKVFGLLAVAPIAGGVVGLLAVPAGWQAALFHAVIIWSASILCFLAGVRRGDSFHTPDGPTPMQLPAIFAVWAAGLAALLLTPVLAVLALLIGFLAVAVLDTWGARHWQAPRFFARFRPVQMIIPILSLAVLLAWTIPIRDAARTGWGCDGGWVCLGSFRNDAASFLQRCVQRSGATIEGNH